MTDLNSATRKTSHAAISEKIENYRHSVRKKPWSSRALFAIFDGFKISPKISCSRMQLIKDEAWWCQLRTLTTNRSRVTLKFCAKMGPRAATNGPSLILMTDLNSAASKTPWLMFRRIRTSSTKWLKKRYSIVGQCLGIFDDSKIFMRISYPLAIFYEKKTRVTSAIPYDQPFTSYAKIFCKNGI